jgi:hypothetical protein
MLSTNDFSSIKYKFFIFFLPVLGIKHYKIKTSCITHEDVLDIKNTINKYLGVNNLANNTKHTYELLSLFAALNIYDNRLTDLLECFTKELLETTDVFADHPDLKDFFSPINTACIFGNCDALNKLLSRKNMFYKMDISIGVLSAIHYGYPEIISCFLKNKINIYELPYSHLNNKNIIHITCETGSPKVLAVLLENLPCDEMLFEPTIHFLRDGLTPYELALSGKTDGHRQCAELLEDTRAVIWFKLQKAVDSNNFDNIQEILSEHPQKNILIMFTPTKDYSIFEISNWLVKPELYQSLITHFTGLSITDQINILLNLDIKMNDLATQTHDKMLLELMNDITLIEELNLDLSIINTPFILKCHEELILNNAVKKLTIKNSSVFENLSWLRILKLLAQNTSIIEGGYKQRPCKLLKLIIKRNSAMSQFKNAIFKDTIFNKYVPAINECINKINSDYSLFLEKLSIQQDIHIDEYKLVPIKEIKNSYSLSEFCLFSLSTKPGCIPSRESDPCLYDDFELKEAEQFAELSSPSPK